ncbi:MAG: ATP12 family chaperone protein [Kiloniellales bacterium]
MSMGAGSPGPMGPMKRFYREAVAVADGAGCRIELDRRPLHTPGRALLLLPSRRLAEAIAEEWAAQDKVIAPQSMPLMALACTATDLVAPRRAETVGELAAYGESDLICYRAEQPEALVRRQAELWQPLLDWAALAFDAPLLVTSGIVPRDQPPQALAALHRAVEAHDDLALAALAAAVRAAGSLVIGLALSHGRLDAAAAFADAELDASYQMEIWGEDHEALQRRALVKAELQAAERFLALLRG